LVREEKCVVVKGVVCDAQGEAIVGVNIIEKGTMNGVTTDRRGKFSLEVDLHGTLIVSFVGYRTRIIPVEGRTDLRQHIFLPEPMNQLSVSLENISFFLQTAFHPVSIIDKAKEQIHAHTS